MYSFYGGRPGNSFIIIKNFPSVNAMKTQFKKGPAYTEVHYDEHVLIDTEDKNNAENGQIYKRGYNYTNEMGGAEYIGRIVGPAGPAPNLALTENLTIPEGTNPTLQNAGSYNISKNLVPGKYIDNNQEKFNDDIQWISYSIKDANSTETTAYIGFKIPYTVFDISAQTIDSHQNASVSEQQASDGRINHPFYKKLKFNIPKGIKGDTLKNLKVIQANQNVIYPYPDGDNTPQQEKDAIDAKKQDDIDNGREILVYEYHNYDNENEVIQLIYLGDYKMIQNIGLSENGTLNIQYTNHDTTVFNNRIKYIKDVSLANDGTLTLIFNTYETVNDDGITPVTDGGNNPINQQIVFQDALKSISEIRLSNISYEVLPEEQRNRINNEINQDTGDEEEQEIINYPFDGTVAIEYNNGSRQLFPNIIKTIDYMRLENNGDLNVKYINSQEIEKIGQVVTVNQLIYNKDTGLISYTTNNDISPKMLGTIKEIKNFQLNNDGTIMATYNDNLSPISINPGTPIKWINSMKAQNNGDLLITYNTAETLTLSKALDIPKQIYLDNIDQKLKIKWKSSEEPQDLTVAAINYIKDVAIDKYGHLLMQFSDPTVQTNYIYRGVNWKNLGTISATGFAFNDTTTSISNKYLSGILNPESNNLKLLFDLDTAKILNRVATTTIDNCLIKIYYNNNLIDTITINTNENPIVKSHNYTIQTSVFGFSFVFDQINNTNNINQTTPVNIVIENMDLSFVLTEDSSEEEDVDDLVTLAKKVENLDLTMGNISALNPNFYNTSSISVASALDILSGKIGLTTISSETTGGTTITESLKNLKTTTDIIGTTPINTTFYGTSPTITSSLDVLQNKIGTSIISEATTGGNQIVSSLQNLKTTIDNFKTSITTNEMIAQILRSKSDIWIDKETPDTDNGISTRWADGNFHYLVYRGKSRDYGYFGTGAYSDQYKFGTVLQGYYTYLKSKKGIINTDLLWKTKGDIWTTPYAGAAVITGGKELWFTVGIPPIAGGTLTVTKVYSIGVRSLKGGATIQPKDITKNINVICYPANARIHLTNINGISGLTNNAPCGFTCWIEFKVV